MNVIALTIPTVKIFLHDGQFMGFAGSSGPSQSTIFGSASAGAVSSRWVDMDFSDPSIPSGIPFSAVSMFPRSAV